MKKILFIEDSPEVRETTAEILELADYQVETAVDGKEGIEKVNSQKPDLIICDIMMPGLDGFGVLNILSRKPATAGIPFIFLTAKSEKKDMRRGMSLGADDYLTKPFEATELLDAIEVRLKKNEVLKNKFTKNIDGLIDFFDQASAYQELKDLSKDRTLKTYIKKQLLFMEGNPAYSFYFIHSGKVKTYKDNVDGKEFVTGLYGAGDFFGYLPLLSAQNIHNETAKVMEAAEICTIPREDLFKLIHANPKVSQKFIKILANNLLEREDELVRVAYDSVRQRVAQALLNLMAQKGNNKDEIEITREDLAGLIGIAKETVIRTLSDFKEEGAIAIQRKKIAIKNKNKLMEATL